MMRTLIRRSLLRFLALIKKEILPILMDKKSRAVLFAPIIVQCIIFGYGASYHLESVPYAIYNQSNDSVSYEIEQELLKTPKFKLIEKCHTMGCLRESVDSQKSLIGIFIDSNFKNTLQANIILDARNTASANTASGYVTSIIENINNRLYGKSALNINSRFLFNENNYTRYTILIGMTLALSVIQVLLLSSLSVSREKEEGSYDMMIMTPARPFEMLIGKAIPPIVIAFIQSFILIAICRFYFEIPMRGNIFAIFTLITIFAFAIVGIGLAISTLSKTTMQSLVAGFSLCLVLIMASGLITAVDGMPYWFKAVAYCNPVYYGINSMWQLYLQGCSIFDLTDKIIPLIMVGIVTLSMASYLFRHKLE